MGLMDQFVRQILNDAIPNGTNPMVTVVIEVLNRSGGLGGLMQLFQSKGLGHIIQSWISPGENIPVHSEQVEDVFGRESLHEIEREHNLVAGDLKKRLAEFLPSFVNELTPNGQIPQGNLELRNVLAIGKRVFGTKDDDRPSPVLF